MRSILLNSLAAIALVTPVLAQESNTNSLFMLPEINVDSAARKQPCVDSQADGNRSYNCLNQKLRREVDRVNPSVNLPPVDARSPDIRVGVVNMPAVKQQYGRNYGISVIPYRPGAPVFTAPMPPRR